MLEVGQYEYIRVAHRVYGKSIREIARETGHSRNTVRKALKGEYKGYSKRKRQPYPVLGPYLGIIDAWLKEDQQRPKKQRHTARRIYERLRSEHGFQGSERTVSDYVRKAKLEFGIGGTDVYIPLEPELGKEAEVDWGRCYAILKGEYTSLRLFAMRSKGSGKHFVQCFPCERQQALFEGHIRAFEFFGGVFPVMIYDNTSTIVEEVYRGKNRKLRENFLKFQAYYNFSSRFCNPGCAHEKGGVEGLVGYSRRNYMVPIPEADSLEDLNKYLLERCYSYGERRLSGREKTVNELYEEEKSYLLKLPETPFSNIETYRGKADKYSTVLVDRNRYSVPTRYVGLQLDIVATVERVEIFYRREKIAYHERVYGSNKWQLNPFHYLELISRRPQAFDSARPLKEWRKSWPDSLEKLLKHFRDKDGFSKGTKEFISVLLLFEKYDKESVEAAVEEAVKAGVSGSDAIEHMLMNMSDPGGSKDIVPLENWLIFAPADVSVYDKIGGAI